MRLLMKVLVMTWPHFAWLTICRALLITHSQGGITWVFLPLLTKEEKWTIRKETMVFGLITPLPPGKL